MRTVPRNQAPKITFFQGQLPRWARNAEQLGLNPDDIAMMTARTEAAQAALIAQRKAQLAAEAATLDLREAMDAMATMGASMLLQIRATAARSGGAIYPLAAIDPPAKGSPVGEPGTPFKFEFSIDDNGALHLTWKCKNPRGSVGTMYQVYREVDGSGEMAFLGTTGKKQFTDATVPQGAKTIVYKVRAMRSTKVGQSATFNVSFGVDRAVRKMIAAQKMAA
jgi:hypothetical protein